MHGLVCIQTHKTQHVDLYTAPQEQQVNVSVPTGLTNSKSKVNPPILHFTTWVQIMFLATMTAPRLSKIYEVYRTMS